MGFWVNCPKGQDAKEWTFSQNLNYSLYIDITDNFLKVQNTLRKMEKDVDT